MYILVLVLTEESLVLTLEPLAELRATTDILGYFLSSSKHLVVPMWVNDTIFYTMS